MPKRRPRIEVEIANEAAPKSRLYIDVDVAEALRKVARAERMELTPFLESLLRYWLETKRPQWKLVERDETNKPRRPSR